jgi:hypothetical protein
MFFLMVSCIKGSLTKLASWFLALGNPSQESGGADSLSSDASGFWPFVCNKILAGIGANDVANSFAAIVASKTISHRTAIIIGTCFPLNMILVFMPP